MGFLLLPARRYPILAWKKAPTTQRNRVLRQREQAAEPESRPYGKDTFGGADPKGVTKAIEGGVLEPGARFPSWQDLAAELGVARGTVRTAYEKLAAAQLIEASRATGTRVAQRPRAVVKSEQPPDMLGDRRLPFAVVPLIASNNSRKGI